MTGDILQRAGTFRRERGCRIQRLAVGGMRGDVQADAGDLPGLYLEPLLKVQDGLRRVLR